MDVNKLIIDVEKTINKESNVDAVYRNINKFNLEEQVIITKFYINDFVDVLLNSKMDLSKEERIDFAKSIFFYLATLEKESIEEEITFIIDSFNELGYGNNIDEYLNLLKNNIENKFDNVLELIKNNDGFIKIGVKRLIKYQYCIATVLQSYIDNKMEYLKKL